MFGQKFYENPPSELPAKVEGRSVFAWSPKSKRINEDKVLFHAVVIVGAKVEDDKTHVYYIDPLDGSDPNDITTQKIYAMSYTRLKTSIANLMGERLTNLAGESRFTEMNSRGFEYALHM